jgi:hypothetical protein
VREYPAEGAALHPDVIPGPRGGRPPDFVLLILAYGLNGERIVGFFKNERETAALRGQTRGPMQVGGYASREDPVLLDIVRRFKAGEDLPIGRADGKSSFMTMEVRA